MNRLNFMQSNLTSYHKAMHKLLAIMKKTTTKRRVSFGHKIELINSQLATTKINSPLENSMAADLMKSQSAGLLNMAP